MHAFVKIIRNGTHAPAGKLADAEIHFTGGALNGLKLVGFAVWARRDGEGQNVTFPARVYNVGGAQHRYALLRPVDDPSAHEGLRHLVLQAYRADDQQSVRGNG
jgi:hypothetical protein